MMDIAQPIVSLIGLLLVGAIGWYFLWPRVQEFAHVTEESGVQRILIHVKGGYSPDLIEAKAGKLLQLVFLREETSSCSEEVVFPDFGIRRGLPAFKETTIEFIPQRAGTYPFVCGMNMLHGTLVVK